MASIDQLFARLSVDYDLDDKIISAGEKAELLYIRGLVLCKRLLTDGHISVNQLQTIRLNRVKTRAEKLVEVGLWERTSTGYRVVNYLKWNKSKAQVTAEIQARRESAFTTSPQLLLGLYVPAL